MNILRFRLFPNQDHLVAELSYPFRLIGIEDRLSGGRSRGGGKADADRFPLEIRIDPLVEELFQLLRFQSQDSLFFVESVFQQTISLEVRTMA